MPKNPSYRRRSSRRPRRNPNPLDNPAFRRWFGDSKVVDEQGQPLVVWHASRTEDSDFDEFDLDLAFDIGVHFGSHEAASYFDGVPKPYFLRVEKPLRLIDPLDWVGATRDSTLEQLLRLKLINRKTYERLSGAIADRKKALRIQGTGHEDWLKDSDNREEMAWVRFRAEAGKAIAGLIKLAGYDGVVYANVVEGGESYMVFSPTQIKSATDNVGTFDPNDPSILKNRRASRRPRRTSRPRR